ncbi:MAG: FAD-dependent oxidoreductase [Candidatus Binataceae bacterium]
MGPKLRGKGVAAQLPECADVVVVGGGIVGAASAYFLAKRGVPVVLLERGELAGSSLAGTGVLCVSRGATRWSCH